MPKFLVQRFFMYQKLLLLGVILLIIGALSWFSWKVGLVCLLVALIALAYYWRVEGLLRDELLAYTSTLTLRVKKAGEDVLSELPIGVVLYDEENRIEWHNHYLLQLFQTSDSLVGTKLEEVLPRLHSWLEGAEKEEGMIRHEDYYFKVISRPEERLLYIQDQTELQQVTLKQKLEQNVLLFIHIDNLEEATQGLDEQQRALLVSEVSKVITEWARELGIFLRRTSAERFLGLLSEQVLRKLEENRFEILDRVREKTAPNKIPVTLSIGVGAGAQHFTELGEYAQSSLDLCLGRGGDQVAVKRNTGKIVFYGGKSNAVEKRTRVRARVISQALMEIIRESDQVFIMGHSWPDLDAIGAAIGVLKAVEITKKPGYILLNSGQTKGIDKLLSYLEEDEELVKRFIYGAEALEKCTGKSLLVIVDTHKPSLVMEPKLLEAIPRKVVIDHHRRGEEFIAEPLLVYLEPYASSTSELVTELLEYQSKHVKMKTIEATALLAGIVLDTKNFAYHTGARTFDAASYLRNNGADTTLVQKFLKENLHQFVQRAQIVQSATIYKEQFAIAVVYELAGDPILLAQAADTLLGLDQVVASFVFGQREDGSIIVSARSYGDVNVQVIMEKMNGGGHMTTAATQLRDMDLDDAVQWLQDILAEDLEGGVKG